VRELGKLSLPACLRTLARARVFAFIPPTRVPILGTQAPVWKVHNLHIKERRGGDQGQEAPQKVEAHGGVTEGEREGSQACRELLPRAGNCEVKDYYEVIADYCEVRVRRRVGRGRGASARGFGGMRAALDSGLRVWLDPAGARNP